MIRVLQVLGKTNLGGAESRIMDLYRHMDREQVQFDFLVHRDFEADYDAEIENIDYDAIDRAEEVLKNLPTKNVPV